MQNHSDVPILIVEDKNADGQALEKALGEATITSQITHVHSSKEAMATLHDPQLAFYKQQAIILLDFDMPDMDGHKILAEVKNNQATKDVIIFVFSKSDTWFNRMALFDPQVAGFVKKSETDADYREFASQLKHYFENTPLFAA